MSWIKVRTDLKEDPKVFRLAKMGGVDRLTIVGRMWALWVWTDAHAVDGRVDGAAASDVDEICDCVGFAESLRQVGWLDVGDGFIALPKHERHNGETAKERALKTQRQATWRVGKSEKQVSVDGSVGASVDTMQSTSPSTLASTREEKNIYRERARGARLTPDWEPGPDGLGFAEKHGLRNGKASAELDRFRDYWAAQPGQKGVKTDWPATWRNWVRRSADQQPKGSLNEPWEGAL